LKNIKLTFCATLFLPIYVPILKSYVKIIQNFKKFKQKTIIENKKKQNKEKSKYLLFKQAEMPTTGMFSQCSSLVVPDPMVPRTLLVS